MAYNLVGFVELAIGTDIQDMAKKTTNKTIFVEQILKIKIDV